MAEKSDEVRKKGEISCQRVQSHASSLANAMPSAAEIIQISCQRVQSHASSLANAMPSAAEIIQISCQ